MPKEVKERTCISHNLPFHPENLFSSRENAKKKNKRKRRSRQVVEFMFNKKRERAIYGTKL